MKPSGFFSSEFGSRYFELPPELPPLLPLDVEGAGDAVGAGVDGLLSVVVDGVEGEVELLESLFAEGFDDE